VPAPILGSLPRRHNRYDPEIFNVSALAAGPINDAVECLPPVIFTWAES